MSERPNVLLILADELRADALGCLGNPVCRTPNLDALADSGALLEQCMVTQPTCTPSRASLLTGCYPSALRSRMVGCHTPDDHRFLPRVLAQHGYHTASIGKLHLIPQGEEIALFADQDGGTPGGAYYGFAEVDLVNGHGMRARGPGYSRWLAERVPDVEERLGRAQGLTPGVNNATGSLRTQSYQLPGEVHSGEYIADRACTFLADAAARETPFLLHVSFPDPHHPTTVPEPYAGMYDPADVPPPIPPVRSDKGATELQLASHRGDHPNRERDPIVGTPPDDYSRYTDADWRVTKALYYGMVSLLDAQIGRILATLADTGLDENTIVVFATDHGDYLGDHGLMGKGFGFDSVLRTPMIIRGPGVEDGGRLTAMASTVDLAPTLLDYVDLPEPEGVQGVSMRAALSGTGELPRDAVLTENDDDTVPMRMRTLTTADWKLSWYCNSADGELYDRAADPQEIQNRWHDPHYAEIRTRLLIQLLEQIACAVDVAGGRTQKPAAPVPKWLPRPTDTLAPGSKGTGAPNS